MKGTNFPDLDFSKLIIPPAKIKIVRRNDVLNVFDPLRKGYFILTPEEFVRQIFVKWMIESLGYPPSLMANEIGIQLNDTYKRCDTVVFNSKGEPLMIIEFKAPKVNINQEVFNQIVRYNMALRANYLVICNGYTGYYCQVDYLQNKIEFLESMPYYKSII